MPVSQQSLLVPRLRAANPTAGLDLGQRALRAVNATQRCFRSIF